MLSLIVNVSSFYAPVDFLNLNSPCAFSTEQLEQCGFIRRERLFCIQLIRMLNLPNILILKSTHKMLKVLLGWYRLSFTHRWICERYSYQENYFCVVILDRCNSRSLIVGGGLIKGVISSPEIGNLEGGVINWSRWIFLKKCLNLGNLIN